MKIFYKNDTTYFEYTKIPVIPDKITLNKTAPAEISFICFILESFSGWMKSQIFSMAEFNISQIKTSKHTPRINIESKAESFNTIIRKRLSRKARNSIRKFRSDFMREIMPSKA